MARLFSGLRHEPYPFQQHYINPQGGKAFALDVGPAPRGEYRPPEV